MNKQLAVGSLISLTHDLSGIANYWNTHFLNLNDTEDDLLAAVEHLLEHETKKEKRKI